MEDVAVEGGDGLGIIMGTVGGDGVGILVGEVGDMVRLAVFVELLLPVFAAGGVRHLLVDLLGYSMEEIEVVLLLLRRRFGVGIVDDVGVRSSVACAHDDFAPCVELALHRGDRVREIDTCHSGKCFRVQR